MHRLHPSLLAPLCVAALIALPAAGRAQPPQPPAPPRAPLALFRIEGLGLDAERALRLEMLFRHELERMARVPLPSKGQVERAAAKDRNLRACTGGVECLTAIGRLLGVRHVVSGNVGEMGDSYVINLKLVDVESGQEVRQIQESLRGSPDELIEMVRVAAYRLVSPEKLDGGIAILSDVPGATVFLDGKPRGKTPLARPIGPLPLGKHKLRLTADGYTDFFADVDVRFQKTTQVVVRMVLAPDPGPGAVARRPGQTRPPRTPWYASTWAYAGLGVAAVAVGVLVGVALAPDPVIHCDENPGACGLPEAQ